mgnify:CR=1 FL=1
MPLRPGNQDTEKQSDHQSGTKRNHRNRNAIRGGPPRIGRFQHAKHLTHRTVKPNPQISHRVSHPTNKLPRPTPGTIGEPAGDCTMLLQFPPAPQIVEVWKRNENTRDASRTDKQKTLLQRNLHHPFSFNNSGQNQTADWICHGLQDKGSVEINS